MSNPGEEFFLSFTETIYGVLFEPAATLRSLADHKPYGTALLVFIGVLLWSVVFEQALNVYGDSQIQEMIPANLYWLFSLFGAILSLLVLLVGSGLLSLISELIYGKFNAGGILVVLCYSSIPGILGPPSSLCLHIGRASVVRSYTGRTVHAMGTGVTGDRSQGILAGYYRANHLNNALAIARVSITDRRNGDSCHYDPDYLTKHHLQQEG
jgi:lipid-A-disaccharide synthase-like uncharacterized protein